MTLLFGLYMYRHCESPSPSFSLPPLVPQQHNKTTTKKEASYCMTTFTGNTQEVCKQRMAEKLSGLGVGASIDGCDGSHWCDGNVLKMGLG